MKKVKFLFSHFSKFEKLPQKQYKKKHRFFLGIMYAQLDKWLKKMSLSGWHIVHCGVFTFWFEKGLATEKEYFTYGDPPNEGKYSVLLRHPQLEKKYGVSKKKSKINANKNKAYEIVEIDLNLIHADIGYEEMVNDRNRLYLLYFIRNVLACMLALMVVIALSLVC